MRRLLLILGALLLLCGAKSIAPHQSGIIDSWLFDTDSQLTSMSGIDATIIAASPPAVQASATTTEPFFLQPGANTTYTGPYGLYTPPAVDNLVQRASFETCSGGDPTGWTLGEGGTGSVDCSTTHKAKGANGLKFTSSVGESLVARSVCMPVDATKDYYANLWAYGAAGDEDFIFRILEYSDACSTFLSYIYVANAVDLPAGWSKTDSVIASGTWDVTTAYVIIDISEVTVEATMITYVDEIQLIQSSVPVDSSCTCDTDATCSCSAIVATIPTKITAGTWQFEATIQSPVDGAAGETRRQFFDIYETAPTNKNRIYSLWVSNALYTYAYDKDGVIKYGAVPFAGSANTSYRVKVYHTGTGRIGSCVGAVGSALTCGTEGTAAINETPSAVTHIGRFGSIGTNVHFKAMVWSRRLTDPIGTP